MPATLSTVSPRETAEYPGWMYLLTKHSAPVAGSTQGQRLGDYHGPSVYALPEKEDGAAGIIGCCFRLTDQLKLVRAGPIPTRLDAWRHKPRASQSNRETTTDIGSVPHHLNAAVHGFRHGLKLGDGARRSAIDILFRDIALRSNKKINHRDCQPDHRHLLMTSSRLPAGHGGPCVCRHDRQNRRRPLHRSRKRR